MSELKKLSSASLFFALSALFVTLQIPTWNFLTIELSLVFVLLARRTIGLKYSTIITVSYPWFALLTPWVAAEPIGVASLVTTGLIVLYVDYFFIKDKGFKKDLLPTIISIIIVTILATFLSMVLYTPAYYGFNWNKMLGGGGNILNYIWINLGIYIPFNLLKSIIIFTLASTIKYKLKKHI